MARIDLAATIEQVDFPEGVWAWLDLLGDVVVTTEAEAVDHEGFLADTPYKQLLVRSVHKDISTLGAIYTLLRCEFIHQAAGHTRLFCESLITASYISVDPGSRVSLFLDYATIDEFRIISALLDWERSTIRPEIIAPLEARQTELRPEYDRVLAKYDGRPFNWCNTRLNRQADECGLQRLYALVYGQMSAYVHGSAWSLRRQTAYSRKHYDSHIVFVDIATIVRTTLAVWLEWVRFVERALDWSLLAKAPPIISRCEELDSTYFSSKHHAGA